MKMQGFNIKSMVKDGCAAHHLVCVAASVQQVMGCAWIPIASMHCHH